MSYQEELKSAIKKVLPEVSFVIGWEESDCLHETPFFMRSEMDVDRFVAGFFSVSNAALFLPEYKDEKIAVIVKGCDSRSIGQQLAESLVKREDIIIIGFPCEGVIDHTKLAQHLAGKAELGDALSVIEKDEKIIISFDTFEESIAKKDILAEKCRYCKYPNAVVHDIFVGEKRLPVEENDPFDDLAALEELSFEERQVFWEKEMSKCLRCYACRNACPLCACKDHCIASSRDPKWVTQADSIKDKFFFQIIHAVHLAGRCTSCGECQRACPVGIPVGILKRTLARRVHGLFGFDAGISATAISPLQTFEVEEPRIKEREW